MQGIIMMPDREDIVELFTGQNVSEKVKELRKIIANGIITADKLKLGGPILSFGIENLSVTTAQISNLSIASKRISDTNLVRP